MKKVKIHFIACVSITLAVGIFVGVVYSLVQAERQIIMFEAFQRGYAVPVKNDSEEITYQWIEPNLLNNKPPKLDQ